MKLQKLLKKLALPVFALAVVGMLAACSSPSGSGSGSGSGGDNATNLPALNSDTEYTISFDDSITDVDKAVLLAKDIKAGDKVTGAEVEAEKAELTAAGYTYEVNGTMLILKKKTASSSDAHKDEGEGHKPQGGESGGSGQQGGATTVDAVYTFEDYDEEKGKTFLVTITAKKDGSYVAKMNMKMGEISMDVPVEEGTYVLNGNKVTTTATKMMGESLELEEVPDAYKPYATKTYTIGANNVLTIDESGKSGSGSSPATKPENPAEQGGKTPVTPSGIDAIEDTSTYTVIAISSGISNTMQNIPGSSVKSMLRMLPEDAYTISGTTITIDYSKAGQGGTGGQPSYPGYGDSDSDDELDPEQIPASWYKIYYGNNMVDAMSASALDGFAYAVGLVENTDYTIDHTAKKITLTDSGYQKAIAYKSNH